MDLPFGNRDKAIYLVNYSTHLHKFCCNNHIEYHSGPFFLNRDNLVAYMGHGEIAEQDSQKHLLVVLLVYSSLLLTKRRKFCGSKL